MLGHTYSGLKKHKTSTSTTMHDMLLLTHVVYLVCRPVIYLPLNYGTSAAYWHNKVMWTMHNSSIRLLLLQHCCSITFLG